VALRVAFAGGGTGGHIYPALAIYEALAARLEPGELDVRFFGNRQGLEAEIVQDVPLAFVPSAALQRRLSLRTLTTIAANAAGIAASVRALAQFRPDWLVATGGYACFPVVVAARMLRALGAARRLFARERNARPRIALLEINATPGLTTRLLAPLVDEVWVAYAASAPRFGRKAVVTGAPVRSALLGEISPQEARRRLNLDPDRTTIVVIGGSQGARSINEAVAALVTRRTLPDDWQVLHISGARDYAYMQAEERELAGGNRIVLVPYLNDPADAFAAADVVVARAGASTLAELAATGTPAVLIPYRYAGAHQCANAFLVARAGAAVVLDDATFDHDTLFWTLRDVLDPARRTAMREAARHLAPPDAAARIAARITGHRQ